MVIRPERFIINKTIGMSKTNQEQITALQQRIDDNVDRKIRILAEEMAEMMWKEMWQYPGKPATRWIHTYIGDGSNNTERMEKIEDFTNRLVKTMRATFKKDLIQKEIDSMLKKLEIL
jgi:hypothetical protein